ncbi:tRNA(Met) cytidine acetyltransferase TmcA [Thiohalophilus sp.]|uniref:tRNA(Met) cytidine acetyltransferase TmcA n=1 Tax=Thiohalophilus sp. TaxID=3028392 RepID=UPI002ACD7817|nr:GNAT family N-acetyltransferase [Thiohalophilus sp.]MDZ7660801.1 GNAT family N-acetyltransferase [Thiohalophilus sp.]
MPPTTDPASASLVAAIEALQQQARRADQRALIVAAGDPAWGRALAEPFWRVHEPESRLWLTHAPEGPEQTALIKADQLLGQERQLLIFDFHAGIEADAFGAASGTLAGGGLLLMLTPPLADWPAEPTANPYAAAPSRFVRHLVKAIEQDPALMLLQEPDRIRASHHPYRPAAPRQAVAPCRSADQQRAVAALIALGTRGEARPLVITSDRGRGKSAALGIAAARLLEQQPGFRIAVCAPRPQASAALFERAGELLPRTENRRNRLQYAGGFLQFMAADALLAQQPPLDLLLIDEAAALPLPVLERLLTCYPRLAFATTVHGYEGTGRGFALRFGPTLDRLAPGWEALRLNEPIRWRAGGAQEADPLEQFVFHALLLDTEAAPPAEMDKVTPSNCVFVELDRATLIRSPARLRQLFGLLVLAHYRTRPADLQRLLDAPGMRLFALAYDGQPVAVAVLANEGGFDASTTEAIYRGRRRPPGHLLAQSLAFHAGVPDAARYRYVRIMRIGVHPALQRRGLGSTLLQGLIAQLEAEAELDAVGASFSAGAELLPFWQRAGVMPVRLGLTREHTSGRHSALVLKPLSPAGQTVFARARERFEQHWPSLRAGPLRDLEPALATRLQPSDPAQPQTTLTRADREDIDSFVHGLRGYEVCAWPLEKLITRLFASPECAARLDPTDRQLLARRIVDKCDWPTLCDEFKLKGQKTARRRLREAVHRAWQLWA